MRVLVVRGTGEHFCAGADIAALGTVDNDALLIANHAADDALTTFPKPTIAFITGSCVGGGAEIAIACDLRDRRHDVTFRHHAGPARAAVPDVRARARGPPVGSVGRQAPLVLGRAHRRRRGHSASGSSTRSTSRRPPSSASMSSPGSSPNGHCSRSAGARRWSIRSSSTDTSPKTIDRRWRAEMRSSTDRGGGDRGVPRASPATVHVDRRSLRSCGGR